MIEIREGGLDHPAVQDLLAHHHPEAHRRFPVGFAYALPPDALRDPAISFFSGWKDATLLGVAALKRLDGDHAEVKSMRTHPDALRRGVARRLLGHLLGEARARGYARISLETGTTSDFVAANALYEAFGFVDREAFGEYPPSPHNRFMTLVL